jgi:hypothetical protein
VVNGVATDAADATVQWVSGDGRVKITGCGNTVSGNNLTAANMTVTTGIGFAQTTTVVSNNVTVVGSNNTVRASPTRHHPHNTMRAPCCFHAHAPRRRRDLTCPDATACASVAWRRR